MTGKRLKKISWFFLLCCIGIFFLFPIFWMASTAFKTVEQTTMFPPKLLPHPFTLRSFVTGFQSGSFLRYFCNSAIVTGGCVIGNLLSCSLVAYGFARLEARFKNILFTLLLSTMMIPSTVTLLPLYNIYSKLHWINTFYPLIVPSFFAVSAFNVFLLRQFFVTMPKELGEAASIDGCNSFQIFSKIYLPNAKAGLIVIIIFTFTQVWNDYFNPMIYLKDYKKFTMAIGLSFFKNQYSTSIDIGPLMAMSLVSVVPILIVFVIFQKYFVQGIAVSGLKE